MKRRTLLASGAAALTGCVGGGTQSEITEDSPIQQMATQFNGNPEQSEIRDRVDNVLEFHDLPTTDQNRARLGNIVLEETGSDTIDEMTMLTCLWGEPPRDAEWSGTWDKIETTAEACA